MCWANKYNFNINKEKTKLQKNKGGNKHGKPLKNDRSKRISRKNI